MAKQDDYLTYEQVLQRLQINRSQLNQLIREGRLREHVIGGETKFRRVEAEEVGKSLQKEPTVVAEGASREPATDLIEQRPAVSSREPGTEVLAEKGEPDTDMLEEGKRPAFVERDTEILEEEAVGKEFELEGEAADLGAPLAAEPAASDTALATELELKRVGAGKPAKAQKKDEFFDFTDAAEAGELELEEAPKARAAAPAPKAEEEEEELVTDILDLGAEEEVAEEDLLSEIMEIKEERGEAPAAPATEDITAEITTIEEPTYEDSDLGEVLQTGGVEFAEEPEEAEAFLVPAPEPVGLGAEPVGGLWFGLLVVSMVVLLVTLLFVVENGVSPGSYTGLTGWNPFGP